MKEEEKGKVIEYMWKTEEKKEEGEKKKKKGDLSRAR